MYELTLITWLAGLAVPTSPAPTTSPTTNKCSTFSGRVKKKAKIRMCGISFVYCEI